MIIINFKNYVTGKRAMSLAWRIEKYLPRAVICVPTVDVDIIAAGTGLDVFAQHFSSKEGKRDTGFVLADELRKAGAKGSLLNHSEHRISEKEIVKSMKIAKKERLKVVLCVKNLAEARKYKKLKPWAMAYEDSKLIGSGKSITNYRSENVRNFVELLKGSGIKALCGAGISSADDARAARKLGCRGALVASAIAKGGGMSKKVENLLIDLSEA